VKLSAILAPLIAAKAPHETIMQVILAYEAEQTDALEKRRATDAERQARKREREKSRDVTVRHSDRSLMRDHVAPVSDKPITTEADSSKNTTSRDLTEFKGALASLNADQVSGLVKIRKSKKAPITGYAANLFIKAAATCRLPLSEAADMCIERNWLTVKPDWINPTARGSPPRQQPRHDPFKALAEEFDDGQDRSQRSDSRDWDDAQGVPILTIEHH